MLALNSALMKRLSKPSRSRFFHGESKHPHFINQKTFLVTPLCSVYLAA